MPTTDHQSHVAPTRSFIIGPPARPAEPNNRPPLTEAAIQALGQKILEITDQRRF